MVSTWVFQTERREIGLRQAWLTEVEIARPCPLVLHVVYRFDTEGLEKRMSISSTVRKLLALLQELLT